MAPTKIDADAFPPSLTAEATPNYLPHEKDFLMAAHVELDNNIMAPTKILDADASITHPTPFVDEAAHANEMLVAGSGDDVVLDNLMWHPPRLMLMHFLRRRQLLMQHQTTCLIKDFWWRSMYVELDNNIMAPTKILDGDASIYYPSICGRGSAHADENVGGSGDNVVLDNLMWHPPRWVDTHKSTRLVLFLREREG